MKCLYKFFLPVRSFIFVMLMAVQVIEAQGQATCPDGSPGGGTAFDTTIAFGSGIVTTQVKFPKFDPQNGMVTCVRLCVTIKGVIDTIAMENYTNAAQTGRYTYTRKDTIRGPGISTYLTSDTSINSSLFPLGANNGTFFSGPDFFSQGPDTVMTKVLCSSINDSSTIVQFYGINDSVIYDYSVNANLIDQVTGGSAYKFVLSSAMVNFHFEYCTCPAAVLPLSVHAFNIQKLTATKVELNWTGFDDSYAEYYYEAEVSKNGRNFSSIGSVAKSQDANNLYRLAYTTGSYESGVFYFRIKQVYANGYVRYSNIKQLELESSAITKFSIYPNPSKGIVGIKFDNNLHGYFNIQVYNTQGQMAVKKDVTVSVGSPYMEVGTLAPGVYWLRVTDKKSLESSVNQLFIK